MDVMENDERLPIPLEWEEPDEKGLADSLLLWFVERVRAFGRREVTPLERASSDGDIASVIRRRQGLGLEFLDDKEDGLDGETDPEPWERRDFVEQAEACEELLRECLRAGLSVEVLPDLRLRSGFDTRLETTLGSDAKGSEDGGTSDGADTIEDAIGRAEGGF